MEKRYLIGQYGGYDAKKTERDFRESFYGMEICMFKREEDADRLLQASEERSFRIGIHYPFMDRGDKVRDALFMSRDEEERRRAFEAVKRELDVLRRLRPEYVLFHYPKPVILDDRLDWSIWSFAQPQEYMYESQYPDAEFAARSEDLFRWLTERGSEYGFTPVLEFDGLTRYIYETELLETLLDRYPSIRLCLDTARLHLQDRMDPYFDAERWIRRFAKYAKLVHLSNLQIAGGKLTKRHWPVLPEQTAEEGWAPIHTYLKIVREENPEVLIHFEHRSDRITDEELDRCYRWVETIMRGGTG